MNASDSITGTAGRVQISGCGPVTVPPAPAPADGGAGPGCGKTVPSDGVAAAQAAQDQLEQSLRLPVAPRAAGPGSGWHPGRAQASGSGGDSVATQAARG